MPLQDQWTVEVGGNIGKLNNMTVIGGLSAYLTGSITKLNGMVVVSYNTGNGMVQWHLYVWDETGSTWRDVTNPNHTHTAAVGDGGNILNIFTEKTNAGIVWFNDAYANLSNWPKQEASGTGASVTSDPDSPSEIMQTGTTTGGYATIMANGMTLDFSDRARFNGMWKISAITNVLFRWGVEVENPNAAPNNNAKFGIEWCDSQATSRYYALTANGSSRSLADTLMNLAADTPHGVRIVHYPADKVQYLFNNGILYDKTTILPAGASVALQNVRWGLKNNNGGAANRTLTTYATFFVSDESTSLWPDT